MFLDDDLPIAMAKRALAPPGAFTSTWPGATDADVAGLLADGFGSARLAGFFSTHSFDMDNLIVDPDLTDAGLSLVVAYTALNALQSKVLTMATGTRYKAGPVEAETTPLATVLVKLLDQAQNLIVRLQQGAANVTPLWSDGLAVAISETLYLSEAELGTPVFPRF